MNETKQPTQSRKENVTQSVFWGTIALGAIATLVFGYFLAFSLRQDKTAIIYIITAIFLLSFLAALTSLVLAIRGRQKLAAELVLYTLLLMGVSLISVLQGRAQTASLSILTIAIITILYLLPGQLRRWYFSITAVTLVVMWLVEWINPPWRIQVAAAPVGPAAVIFFTIIIAVLAFLQQRTVISQRFLSISLRAKLLVSIVSITGLALLMYGVIFIYRTQQSQTFWASELQENVRQQSQEQITNTARFEAHSADQALTEITQAVQQLADYRASLFANQSGFGQGGYWDGNSKLVEQSAGQYGNAVADPASVFIPNTVTLSPSLIEDLNTSLYLDFSAPAILKEYSNIVALYYVGSRNYTIYYPNIDLAGTVPPDFDATSQNFYTVATPQNDPERIAKWTAPYQDPAGSGLIVTTSVPVYDQNNQFHGVMSADVQLSKISQQISTVKMGESGFAFLIDPSGHIIAMPEAGYKLFGIEPEVVPVGESPKSTLLGFGSIAFQPVAEQMVKGEDGLETVTIADTQYYVAYAPLPVIGYSIGLIAPTSELDARYLAAREKIEQETRVTTYLSILILLVVLVVAGIGSLFLGQFLATPLKRLTATATEVAKGNLSIKAEVQSNDEIGLLASTFNMMTGRLQDILGSLEQRVADRTRNLELAAEVGRAVSEVRDLDVMLRGACDLILKEFGLYYVQVYLTDPNQTKLVLEAGTGSVGAQLLERGHNLPFDGNSINGRAAVEKHSVVISDTAESATFRQNPLLPDTRGEMAVPLIVANRVVGVLDMQSREPGVLNTEILPAFEALAGQLAVAIQNSNLLAETVQARAEVEKQARRLVRTGWNEHLDAIHKPEKLGFVFSQNEVTALVDSDELHIPADGKAVSAPIAITGEPLGSLVVEIDDESHRDQTAELVNVVARQVAQQIENLRLLESAERYRYEAEEASRRLTTEGWKSYRERAGENLGYFYDLNEVRPQGKTDEPVEATGYTLPLKVREETIGKLVVQGLKESDEQSMNVANVVMERLGAHIESLRQFEETQRGQLELDKRAHQLAAVAEVSSVSARELDIQKMLASVVHLTQRKFGLYHAHVFTYTEQTEMLKIMACGWKEGDVHEGTHGTAAIPLSQEQSLVARTARTRQPVISNDVHNEPGWLPNPLLSDTRAEMAVPLLIGDKILGVLDVQSDKLNAFSQEDASIFTTLAAQIATALQNAQSFVQAQKQAERESRLNVISQKIQSATTVEAVLQIAARELGHTLGAPLTIAQLGLKETPNNN